MRFIFPSIVIFVALLTIQVCEGQGCEGKICGDNGSGGSCGYCTGHQVCTSFGAACFPPLDEGLYRVGVDYHSTTDDFSNREASTYRTSEQKGERGQDIPQFAYNQYRFCSQRAVRGS